MWQEVPGGEGEINWCEVEAGAGEFIRGSCRAKMAALTDCLSRCFSNYGPRNNTRKLQAGLVTPKSDMTWPQN